MNDEWLNMEEESQQTLAKVLLSSESKIYTENFFKKQRGKSSGIQKSRDVILSI